MFDRIDVDADSDEVSDADEFAGDPRAAGRVARINGSRAPGLRSALLHGDERAYCKDACCACRIEHDLPLAEGLLLCPDVLQEA